MDDDDPDDSEVIGQISITATTEGDSYSVTGAFADRLQYAALAMIKTLGEIADKIRDTGGAGHTSSEPMRASILARRTLPPSFLETTDFGELADMPPPRKRHV